MNYLAVYFRVIKTKLLNGVTLNSVDFNLCYILQDSFRCAICKKPLLQAVVSSCLLLASFMVSHIRYCLFVPCSCRFKTTLAFR